MKKTLFPISVVLCIVLTLSYAYAQMLPTGSQDIHMKKGKSQVFKTYQSVKRVSIASPEIADCKVLSPTELYITAKSIGTTNLMLWSNGGVVGNYDIIVSHDITRIKEQINELLPTENEIKVLATNETITLSGRVSSAANASQAMSIVQAYSENVNNLMEVGGVHQVMLELRVAEMQKSTMRRLGVNITAIKGPEGFGVTRLGSLFDIVPPNDSNIASGGPFGVFAHDVVNTLLRFKTDEITWTGFIDFLKEEGLVKVLAEPTLVAQSGKEANFLAGGEFPIPVPQGLGTVAIEYKPFGVGLTFKPVVVSPDRISIQVFPEVSELDFTTAFTIQGFVVPGLSTRRASTTVELADGQSFVIAGLLRDTMRSTINKYPVLGDLPILGALFRSTEYQKNATELVIIATPRLAKPINGDKQILPTDFHIDPTDAEFYLWGRDEGRIQAKGKMDGDFGHEIPE